MSSTQIKQELDSLTAVLDAVHATLESMAAGDRMQVKQLVQTVGLAVAKDPNDIFPLVHFIVSNTDAAYITRGKNGGVIKGTRPVKAVKESEV